MTAIGAWKEPGNEFVMAASVEEPWMYVDPILG